MRNWQFNHIDFSTYPQYDGDDLGIFWTPEQTKIKIWAPTANRVELRLFKRGDSGEAYFKTNLQPSGDGIWKTVLTGDYEGKFYTLRINDGDWLDEGPDIYARCVGINGLRGMICDFEKTNPRGWKNDQGPELKNPTDAILYEVHVRDFTIAENSGVQYKGKFRGFGESNRLSTNGYSTGIDHLLELGITHVHLLPVNDFATIDESAKDLKYNWGYDPLHYNSLEGSYSTDPEDGRVRIKEFKSLVKRLHAKGLGVIMDVVYNHTYYTEESVFNQTVPGYFYRQKRNGKFSNASGCGNEIASERYMVRKYILDSLKFWTEEYHIDGFRFDLMGILDIQTMNIIRTELDRIRPGILLYGEGWAADQSPMTGSMLALKENMTSLPGIACFNDDFRDALKGFHGDKKSLGYVSGKDLGEEPVKFGIVGAIHHSQIVYDYVKSSLTAWAEEPVQCINYVSCHDNYTLWDKLKMSNPEASVEELTRQVRLAGALVLTAQGIPLLHAGSEFCRTKGGDGNSYKSPDSVNQLDWTRKEEFSEVYEYFRGLIQMRKQHPAFRIPKSDQVRSHLDFCFEYQMGVIAFCIDGKALGDSWSKIILVFNANTHSVNLSIPKGTYQLIANGDHLDITGADIFSGNSFEVEAVSMGILIQP